MKNQNTLLETLSELDQDCSVVYDAIEYGHEHVALSPLESGGKSDGIDATGRNALHVSITVLVRNMFDDMHRIFLVKSHKVVILTLQ